MNWRISYDKTAILAHKFLSKAPKSKQIKRLGKNVKYVIAHSENGSIATDPEDLEVGHRLRANGSFGMK